MCGIAGYTGSGPALPALLDGLARLEYRGYDSAGVALAGPGGTDVARAVGNLASLRARLDAAEGLSGHAGTAGIGHTRWATHGRVEERNAHPHTSGPVSLVLNGIVENYLALRGSLEADGHELASDTDAEVACALIASLYDGDLGAAVRAASLRMEGHYAFAAMSTSEPGLLAAYRKECPLVIGRGDGEQMLSSDASGFIARTRRAQYLHDGDLALLTPEGVSITCERRRRARRTVETLEWEAAAAEKGGHDTFMAKEIHEQPLALRHTLAGRVHGDGECRLELDEAPLRAARRVTIVACGTSWHAGLIAKHAIERWARIPVDVDVASEYRYREPVVGPGDLVIGVTQSGETADTLAAMRLASRAGAHVIAVTNMEGSAAVRAASQPLLTRAGAEVGVAATKTFTAQVAALLMLGLRLGRLSGALDAGRARELGLELAAVPAKIEAMLPALEAEARQAAGALDGSSFFLFLGRGPGVAVAQEGALKLKEISYIPSDAYAAGEMKHGPIALLSDRTPVICVAAAGQAAAKLASNVQEVRARGAHVIAVSSPSARGALEADLCLEVPDADEMISPLLSVVALQLLSYCIARSRGLNVDQPRNLAKTVTVE